MWLPHGASLRVKAIAIQKSQRCRAKVLPSPLLTASRRGKSSDSGRLQAARIETDGRRMVHGCSVSYSARKIRLWSRYLYSICKVNWRIVSRAFSGLGGTAASARFLKRVVLAGRPDHRDLLHFLPKSKCDLHFSLHTPLSDVLLITLVRQLSNAHLTKLILTLQSDRSSCVCTSHNECSVSQPHWQRLMTCGSERALLSGFAM